MTAENIQFKAEWTLKNRHLETPTFTLAEKVAGLALVIFLGLLPLYGLVLGASYLLSWGASQITNRIASSKTLPSAHPPTEEETKVRICAKLAFEALWKGPLGKHFEPIYQTIITPDGAQLQAVWIKHKKATKDTPTLIYFPGNFQIFQQFPDWPFHKSIETNTPCHFVLFNYRGVDGSTGFVRNSKDLTLDGDAVVQCIRKVIGTRPENILFYGLSLGGAVALETQALDPDTFTGRTVNHNSFASSNKMIALLFNTWPFKQLATWAFSWQGYSANPAEAFKKLKGEKLIVVNFEDGIIPPTATLQTEVQHDNVLILEPEDQFKDESEKVWRHHAAPLEWHKGAIDRVWDFLFGRKTEEASG